MSNMTDTMTAERWLETYGVTFDWSANGYRSENGWEHHDYTLTLRSAGFPGLHSGVDIPWKQGLGVDDEPTAERVLWAVAQDVRYGDMDWPEFAGEFGYDEHDARLSEYRSWEACAAMRKELRAFCANAAPDHLTAADMFEDFKSIEEADTDDE